MTPNPRPPPPPNPPRRRGGGPPTADCRFVFRAENEFMERYGWNSRPSRGVANAVRKIILLQTRRVFWEFILGPPDEIRSRSIYGYVVSVAVAFRDVEVGFEQAQTELRDHESRPLPAVGEPRRLRRPQESSPENGRDDSPSGTSTRMQGLPTILEVPPQRGPLHQRQDHGPQATRPPAHQRRTSVKHRLPQCRHAVPYPRRRRLRAPLRWRRPARHPTQPGQHLQPHIARTTTILGLHSRNRAGGWQPLVPAHQRSHHVGDSWTPPAQHDLPEVRVRPYPKTVYILFRSDRARTALSRQVHAFPTARRADGGCPAAWDGTACAPHGRCRFAPPFTSLQ